MKDRASVLPMAAVGISLMAHVAVLLFVPYHAPRLPEPPARELIPIRLLAPSAAVRAPGIRRSAPRPAASGVPTARDAPEPREAPPVEELVPPRESPAPAHSGPVSPSTETAALADVAPAGQQAPAASEHVGAGAPTDAAQPGAEIAAYQLILSTLRGRIIESIHYPAIARANGWEGMVVVAVRLDAAGRLEQAVVRRSSGHEVLDRAAAALLKKVTPVANPLSQPVTIEVPIAYELK
ncbi:MAG: hypothetical protein A2177_05820 [Spirochaetes bacterium RBG_13_68_11]|nr:MAG: hypothetical protein A2177_05820 [Spirochaetes bacterium RBG_13_68_11]